ncbi:MAG: PQQ-binding-like beta-propeller repeat protein, partial [Planctomycetota bacterium]
VSNGKVFTAAVKSVGIENQIYLLCFDGHNGNLLWKRFICSKITNQSNQRAGELAMPLLGENNGLIFCNTNHGVIAALAEESGAIAWLVNYLGDSLSETDAIARRQRVPYQGMTLPDRSSGFPIINKNLLCCLPFDEDKIFCFDVFTGKKIWEKTTKPQGHIVGMVNDDLIVYDQELSAINFSTGKLIWSALGGLGLGLSESDFVTPLYFYFNAKEGLSRVDLENKKIINTPQPWFDKENARTILMTRDGLLAVSDTQISLYYDISRFMAEYKEQEFRQPDNLKLLYENYIKVMIENEKFSETIEALRGIKARINSQLLSDDNRVIFGQMMQILMVRYEYAARANWDKKNLDECFKEWQLALDLAGSEEDRARIKLRLADACVAKQLPEEAVMLYDEIIQKYQGMYYEPLISASAVGLEVNWRLKTDFYAALQIDKIINTAGRAAYRKIELQAEPFAAQIDFNKKNDLMKFLKTYPNARRANEVIWRLAQIFYRENDFKEAVCYFRLLAPMLWQTGLFDENSRLDKTNFSQIFLQTVDCYERLNNRSGLIDFLENSSRTNGEQVLPVNNKKILLKDYSADKIALLRKQLREETVINLSTAPVLKIDKTDSCITGPPVAVPLNQTGAKLPSNLLLVARGNDVECWDIVQKKKCWVDSAEQKSLPVKKNTGVISPATILETKLSGLGGLLINRGFYLQKNNALNGKIIWQYEPPPNHVIFYLRTGFDKIFVGLSQVAAVETEGMHKNSDRPTPFIQNKLVCLDEKDGQLIWELGYQSLVTRIVCSEEYQFLVLLTGSALQIINSNSGQVLYEDQLFSNLPGPSYLHQTMIVHKNKVCYFNRKQELVLYDLAPSRRGGTGFVLQSRMILKQFSGIEAQNLTGVWVSLSDDFVLVSGLSQNPVVIKLAGVTSGGTDRELPLAGHFKNQPAKTVWRSFLTHEGICYFWTQNFTASDNTALPTLSTIFLSYDLNQDRVLWKSPLNDFTYMGSINTGGENCILSVGNFVSRSLAPFSVIMIDKKSGKRIWETSFIHNSNMFGYPSVQINGRSIIVTTQEGVVVYQ